jgi:Holliday junction resolvasome RuvABC ATP-dependent DNA helicase subunit
MLDIIFSTCVFAIREIDKLCLAIRETICDAASFYSLDVNIDEDYMS